MGTGSSARDVKLVILTDRVVVPERNHYREWALHETLHGLALPANYGGAVRPMIVVANRVDHLAALVDVAVAVSSRSEVDDSDWAIGADKHRFERARHADELVTRALGVLCRARSGGTIDPLVFEKLRGLLTHQGGDRIQFSKDWEYAAPLYCTMTIEGWRGYEEAMVSTMLGKQRSPDSQRQDRVRARSFMGSMHSGQHQGLTQAPKANAAELTEKYLATVMPMILPQLHQHISVDLDRLISVTPRGGHVTSGAKKSGHAKSHRSTGTTSLPALPSGFFARA